MIKEDMIIIIVMMTIINIIIKNIVEVIVKRDIKTIQKKIKITDIEIKNIKEDQDQIPEKVVLYQELKIKIKRKKKKKKKSPLFQRSQIFLFSYQKK